MILEEYSLNLVYTNQMYLRLTIIIKIDSTSSLQQISLVFRVDRIAQDISEDFSSESIVALCVLKGGFKFFADLTNKIVNVPMSLEFIRLKSYVVRHWCNRAGETCCKNVVSIKRNGC